MKEQDFERFDFDYLFGRFSYEELFEISKPLDESLYKEKYFKYNKLKVSSYDNIKQMFYDIANSKESRSLYRKINATLIYIHAIYTLFILGAIFSIIGNIISLNRYFLFDRTLWDVMLCSFIVVPLLPLYWFYRYEGYITYDKKMGQIDFSQYANKTGHSKLVRSRFTLINPLSYRVKRIKNVNRSSYMRYNAHNGKTYLIEIDNMSRFYAIRNWYLISKYITCNKMTINDLPIHFEDEFFFFCTSENFKPNENNKLKLSCLFNWNFSLNCFTYIWKINYSLGWILPFVMVIIELISIFQ